MPTTLNVIKTITIRGSAEGIAEVERQLASVATKMEGVTVASEKQEKATLSVERAYQKLQQRYDQEFRAQQALAQTQKILDAARAQGLVSEQRAADLMQRSIILHNQSATASKASRFELINLSRQIQDVGVSLASGQSPFLVLIQQGSQIADVFTSSQLTLAQWGQKFLSFLNPVTLAVGGLIIAIGGLVAVYLTLNQTGRFSTQVLEDQKKLLGEITTAFNQAARGATAFLDANRAIFQLKLQEQLAELTKQLATFRVQTQRTVVTPTSVPSEIPGVPGVLQIENAERTKRAFDEINNAINRFNKSARDATDVIALRKEVAEIGAAAIKTNPELAKAAQEFINNTEQAGNAAEAIRLIRLQVQALLGDLKAMKELGFPLPVDEMEKFIQRTKDHIAVRQQEAASIGKSAGETARLKIQLEAERISKEKGIPIDQKRLDGLKNEAAAAEDAYTTGQKANDLAEKQLKLRQELARETETVFFSREDQQIAERLKDIYPSVTDAINSAEAAQLRFNNRIREAQDLTGDFLNTFVQGMVNGKSATDALSGALKSLGQSISSSAIKDLGTSLTKAISGGGTSGLFGGGSLLAAGLGVGVSLLGSLFGGDDDDDKAIAASIAAAAQAAEQAAAKLEAAQARARAFEAAAETTLLDTNTLEGALKAFEVRAYTARFEEAKAGGEAMGNLEKSLALERLKILNDFAERVLRRQESFQDRLFQATIDPTTLEGQLALFDRQAQRERETEIRAGGEAIVELEMALAAERAKIVKDFNDQALQEQIEANNQQLEEQRRAQEEQLEEQRRAQEKLNSIARTIVDFVKGLFTRAEVGGSPTERLRAAQANYEETLKLARQGNEEALDRITAEAETYREALRVVYGSTIAYQHGVQQIAEDLLGLPAVQDSTDQIVNAIRDSIIVLERIDSLLRNGAVPVTAAQKGGWVTQGVPWRDSALVFASRDEFVVNSASARRYGGLLEAINDNTLGAVGGGGGGLVAEIRALRSDIMRGFVVSSENVREGVDEVAGAMTIIARDQQLKKQAPAA